MLIHALLYLLIAAAYAETALHNLRCRNYGTAMREISIAALHAGLATMVAFEHAATAAPVVPILA